MTEFSQLDVRSICQKPKQKPQTKNKKLHLDTPLPNSKIKDKENILKEAEENTTYL